VRGFVINRREAVERARKARSVRLLLLAQRWDWVDAIGPLNCDIGTSPLREIPGCAHLDTLVCQSKTPSVTVTWGWGLYV